MKRTVLIVDDQQVNRLILSRLLRDEYDVLEAADGREAMAILQERAETISAVLLDIVMPVMDGHEVLRAMGQDPKLSKIPVIVSSQKDGDEAEIEALSLGAQDFVAKPYKGDIIRRRLGNIIRLRETAALINKVERDDLTGLLSKQFFFENAAQQLRESPQGYDLLCVGVERFKLINETFGTEKGDDLLRYMGETLQATLTPVLAARFNADMFYLLLRHQDAYTDAFFAPWLAQLKAFPLDMDIKTHCGIYMVKNAETPISVMCDRAKLAAEKNKGMYDAAFCLYDESLRSKLMEEQFILSNMRTALKEEQFQVYYQPKYDLNNELVAGAEALVRWIHPTRGFMSPGAFIPLLERNGFITQLDQYVWETACRDIRRWLDAGLPAIAVSVNVSRADVYNPRLSDILLGLLAKYQVPIRCLHLEITESAYTDNPAQIILVVNRLRELGFVIEMDDFGSGYSSLNMLADMPVDVLKLDMKFIQSETHKASGRGVLSFVISLAKWLNLAVVAEGVETAEQISALRSMDCNYVQGFYYARPMPRNDFEHLIRETKTTEMLCYTQTVQQYMTDEQPEAAPATSRRMLIVDDIQLNRVVLAGTFDREYVIVERENGAEAWAYLQEHYDEVEIVLLDLLMPVMDGFRLLEKIRGDKRMEDLPVIITSQGDGDSEARALQMNADDFISKPYSLDIIRHRVHNVVAVHRLAKIEREGGLSPEHASDEVKALRMVETLKPHFDIVRLVEPEHTLVCSSDLTCDLHACYAVWGKVSRCNNCISLKALQTRGRCSKLEYSANGLYYVISEYVPYGKTGAVVEMVSRLDDTYVDNIFDKKLLYANLDAVHQQLDRDELTGVFNRRYLDKALADYVRLAKESGRPLGVGMVDVDHFKHLNDTCGHLKGDIVLTAVARILTDNVATGRGDFVARFGGDEFVVACRGIGAEELRTRLEHAARVTENLHWDDIDAAVSISAGLAMSTECPEEDGVALLSRADHRLYLAKNTQRGTVAFEG